MQGCASREESIRYQILKDFLPNDVENISTHLYDPDASFYIVTFNYSELKNGGQPIKNDYMNRFKDDYAVLENTTATLILSKDGLPNNVHRMVHVRECVGDAKVTIFYADVDGSAEQLYYEKTLREFQKIADSICEAK